MNNTHSADAWVYTRPPAPPVDARDVSADVAALRAAHGNRLRDGLPLALVGNRVVPYDAAVGVTSGAGVLFGHLAEPVDFTHYAADTMSSMVRVVTRGRLNATELLDRFGFAAPIQAKRAPAIDYVG